MKEALRLYERLAARAVETAADPRASRTAVDDARHQATFALAAVGAALKAALRAARSGDAEDAPGPS
jgi:hypothetical protein